MGKMFTLGKSTVNRGLRTRKSRDCGKEKVKFLVKQSRSQYILYFDLFETIQFLL